MYIDCTKIAQQWEDKIKSRVTDKTKLAIVTSDYDDASKVYVRNKVRVAERLGIQADVIQMDVDAYLWCETVKELNSEYHGIIIQLPVPPHVDDEIVCECIQHGADVDGLTAWNQGLLAMGDYPCHVPCTPKGILYLMNALNVPHDKHVVIVGRSKLVGRPLASLLTNNDFTVTLCHSKTKDLQKHLERADVIVSAVGKPKFITGDLKGKLIIDVGINRDENGKLCGDVDPQLAENNDVTPVPGGVGKFTVLALMDNLV